MPRPTFVPLLASLVLLLGACRSGPGAATYTPLPPSPPISRAPLALPEPEPPAGVTLSPPLVGDSAADFLQSQVGERTFPHNGIGANLAFTSNLRMPKLEAVSLDPARFQLRMRFRNASQEPLFVSLVCTYEGETQAARSIHRVQFPVNTFRDVAFDLEGDASRKVNIQATAVPAPL